MSNTFVSVIIGIILVAGIGGLVFWKKNANSAQSAGTTTTTQDINTAGSLVANDDDSDDDDATPATQGGTVSTQPSTSANQAGAKTSVEVAGHNSRQSCWSTINGTVYDLTSWIPNHPGGEQAILQLCGTDGSAKFNGQHGGAPKQAAVLVGFKIGVLAQ